MADEILIPQQDIGIKHIKDGKSVTVFSAMWQGKLIAPCEAWGDRKAQLEEFMKSGKPVAIEQPPEHNEQWGRYNVRFPKAGGFSGGGWQKGEKRPFIPAGYKGQPVPYDVWVRTTADMMVQMVAACAAAMEPGCRAKDATVDMDTILQAARSLVAQYWMAVERNITFLPGLEPREAAQPAAAPVSPSHDGVKTPQDGSWESRIAALGTVDACTALMGELREQCQDDAMRAKLIAAVFARQKAIMGVA